MFYLMTKRKRGPITAAERAGALKFTRNLAAMADKAGEKGWLRAGDATWVRERCESFERLSGLVLELGPLTEDELWARVPEEEKARIDALPEWNPDKRSARATITARLRASGSPWLFDVAGLQVGLDRMLTEVSVQDAGERGKWRRARHVRLMLATVWLIAEAVGLGTLTDGRGVPAAAEAHE